MAVDRVSWGIEGRSGSADALNCKGCSSKAVVQGRPGAQVARCRISSRSCTVRTIGLAFMLLAAAARSDKSAK